MGLQRRSSDFIDLLDADSIVGWVCDFSQPAKPVVFRMIIDQDFSQSISADIYRGDVQQAGYRLHECRVSLQYSAAFPGRATACPGVLPGRKATAVAVRSKDTHSIQQMAGAHCFARANNSSIVAFSHCSY